MSPSGASRSAGSFALSWTRSASCSPRASRYCLLFIDEVAKYRDYDRRDTLGDYASVFEEEYVVAVGEVLDKLDLNEATAAYQEYLRRDAVRDVLQGSIVTKGRQSTAQSTSLATRRTSPPTSTPTT